MLLLFRDRAFQYLSVLVVLVVLAEALEKKEIPGATAALGRLFLTAAAEGDVNEMGLLAQTVAQEGEAPIPLLEVLASQDKDITEGHQST